jgi:Fe-S-cluster containining protein
MLLPVTGVPAIEQVDSDVFTLRMHGTCMTCTYCGDSCCQYGCDVNLGERDRILALAAELKPYVKSPVEQWFKPEVFEDPEYPTGRYVRANTAGKGCVFMSPDGRGCAIHRFALKTGRDYHDIKPMVCWLFPVCWDKKVLRPSHDVRDDLVCKGKGMTLYEVTREEVLHVFGEVLVSQLDRHRDAVLAAQPGARPLAALPTASIRSVAPGL